MKKGKNVSGLPWNKNEKGTPLKGKTGRAKMLAFDKDKNARRTSKKSE